MQRRLLVGGFLAGGSGAGLSSRHGTAARLAAITLLLWNPWVYERLLIGQWAILLGYFAAALGGAGRSPDAATTSPRRPRWRWRWCSRAVCSPSSGVMAALVVVVLGLRRSLPHVA